MPLPTTVLIAPAAMPAAGDGGDLGSAHGAAIPARGFQRSIGGCIAGVPEWIIGTPVSSPLGTHAPGTSLSDWDPSPVRYAAVLPALARMQASAFMEVVLVRHGETEWSRDGRHTGRTDVPLTDAGRRQAERLEDALREWSVPRVLTSPLGRALDTCRLAGFGERAELRDELLEWDYGEYEGLTTPQIREQRPDWDLWRDGCRRRRALADVRARAWILSVVEEGLAGRRLPFCARPRAARARRALGRASPPGSSPALARHGHDLRAGIRARDSCDQTLERSCLE